MEYYNIFHYFLEKYAKFPIRSVKLQSAITRGSIKERAMQFAYSRGFSVTGGIERFDRHLCHVTGSDHTHQFGVKQHLDRM